MNGEDEIVEELVVSQVDDFVDPHSPQQNQDHASWAGN